MLFSEFVNIMYKYCGKDYKPHEYFLLLFDTIMKDPETEDEKQKAEEDSYNPFSDLKPDTLDRLFHGTNPLNPKRVRAARTLSNTDKFAAYINDLSWDAQCAINDAFQRQIPGFNSEDNLGYACADLFLQIMDNIYDNTETLSFVPGTQPPVSADKPTPLPATSVYYDAQDGKIHIGSTEIAIPKELEPPDHVAPEEELYIQELLAAYADAEKSAAPFSKSDLDTLPPKYKRNFSDQRINYYSAVRIDRFVREFISDGDQEADKWKSGTLDYIKDTLWDDYDNGYKRLLAVMKKVVDSHTTSVVDSFQNLVGAKEKKGACHLLVNDGCISWVENDE